MYINYRINLVILGLKVCPQSKVNLNLFINKTKAYLYRGCANYKEKSYTLKISRNGFCSIYIKNNFAYILDNIESFVLDIYIGLLKNFFWLNCHNLYIYSKNIQIAFDIILDIKLNLNIFCILIYNHYLKYSCYDNYEFIEIKESNSYESFWIKYDNNIRDKYISSFRLKLKDTIITVLHNYKGTCLTKDINKFLNFCQEIKHCYNNYIKNGKEY